MHHRGVVRLARMFVVFVCIVILAANAWIVLAARAQELRQSRLGSENLARAVAQQMDAIFGETEHVLESLAFELDNRDLGTDSLQNLQPTLVHQVAKLSQLDGLFVLDAQGHWRMHSQSQEPAGAGNAQREDFIHHRDSPSERVRIGAPTRSPTGGHWVIPVSRRLSDPYGRFAGVVLATVSLEHLVGVLRTFQVGARGAILLGRRDGVVLARWPLRDQDVGRTLAGTPVYRELMAAPHGTFDSMSPLDGERRIASSQHARDRPLYVTVALSRREVLQAWRLSATLQTAWAVLLCLIVGGAGAFMVRAVRRRSMAESALRQASDALEQANQQLSHMATHDALTGLANRRALDARLQQQPTAAAARQWPPALLMIDVDHFKQYNDRHGHQAGDECLVRVAAVVRAVADAESGFAARFGGEEMAMLLPAHPEPARVAEAIRAGVAALAVPGGEGERITVSIGLALIDEPSQESAAAWLGAADQALYAAKAAGRNRVVVSGAKG